MTITKLSLSLCNFLLEHTGDAHQQRKLGSSRTELQAAEGGGPKRAEGVKV